MKRIVIILVLSLAALSLSAQGRFSYSLEFTSGIGFGRGPMFTVAPDFVAQYDLGNMVKAGLGVGARFSRPCYHHVNDNGSVSRTFCNEIDVPVFARLSWGGETFYTNLDAGYNVVSLCFSDQLDYGAEGRSIDPARYDGFFFEPQLCWKYSRKSVISLGLLLHLSNVIEKHIYSSPGSYYSADMISIDNVLTPAITLRYGYCF